VSTLLLRLAGPMQAWGGSSRFKRRATDHAPTKSGVIGLLAAAQGLRRTDPLEELLSLKFGVRIDQPGRIERDFQTARPNTGKPMPLTDRYYLTDAIFVAAVSGDDALITGLADAIQHPQFPLYLGRRSCPPAGPLFLDTRSSDIWTSLDFKETPWQASDWWREKQGQTCSIEFRLDEDALPPTERTTSATASFIQQDVPLSFDPEFRQYGSRAVVQTFKTIANNLGKSDWHDPMALLGGA